MSRCAYVVGNRTERDRRAETMPGFDLLLPGEGPCGRRWDTLIIGRGFLQRFREASDETRAQWREWIDNDVRTRVAAGGEMIGYDALESIA